MGRHHFRLVPVAAAAALLIVATWAIPRVAAVDALPQAAQPEVSLPISRLPVLAGYTNVEAEAVSDGGLIVGSMTRTNGQSDAFVFNVATGRLSDLTPTLQSLGCSATTATGINNAGLVVGSCLLPHDLSPGYVLDLSTDKATSLGYLPGGTGNGPSSISNSGLVAGNASNGATQAPFFYQYPTGTVTTFNGPASGDTFAADANNKGVVVGVGPSTNPRIRWSAFAFDTGSGVAHDLGLAPPNGMSGAASVNDSGEVVGYSADYTGLSTGFVLNLANDESSTIGPVAPYASSAAHAIGNTGIVAGDYHNADGTSAGFVLNPWSQSASEIVDPSSPQVASADGVNSRGLIIGNSQGYDASHPLTPFPLQGFYSTAFGATLDQNFVKAAYESFLKRPADSDGLQYWSQQLSTYRITPSGFLQMLATSPEWINAIVTTFYTNTLHRTPDSSGLAYWTAEIGSGALSVAQVAASFYASSEYRGRFTNTAAWVTDLYTELLNRTADQAGVDFWVGFDAQYGPGAVTYDFYQSPESRNTRVAALYQTLLHRVPDSGGLQYWAGRILTDGDVALAANLAASDEYFSDAQHGS